MLNIRNTAFRATPVQPAINYNYKQQQMPMIPVEESSADKEVKKQKQKEKLEKWGTYGTVAIGAALTGQLILTLAMFMSSKKADKKAALNVLNQMNKDKDALTAVDLKWEDFKGKKLVASLDSATTAKSLQKAFNTIIKGSKLSAKALKWGGGSGAKNVDIIYLYGHGGTGKTYVAKQYAQAIDALFTNIKYPNIGSPYKDAASMKISNMFDEIIAKAKANKGRKIVVCIDEIDALIKKVNDLGHGSEEASKSRAAVLTGLDKLREKCSNVTVIATSNYHPRNGLVDEIALRRFNNMVEVPLPDETQIAALLEMYLKDVEKIGAVIDTDFLKSKEAKDFVKKLHKEGYSNGEIELIAQEARKSFSSTLHVPDSEINKECHPFTVEYLNEALAIKGMPASKTNKLMTIREPVESHRGFNQKLTLRQKLQAIVSIIRNA